MQNFLIFPPKPANVNYDVLKLKMTHFSFLLPFLVIFVNLQPESAEIPSSMTADTEIPVIFDSQKTL